MGYLNTSTNLYYEGDKQVGDIEYPSPPGPGYKPDMNNGWIVLPPIVPQSVTPLQARLALKAVGLLDQVNVTASSMPETELAWYFANSVERNSPFVKSLATALNLSDIQIDALFISAAGF